ncbi:MAG: biosynthetic peptidoglycan transglycosylase, partial [Pseudomonadota bacterium]
MTAIWDPMIFRRKKKTERIEPQFAASDRRRPSDELRVGEDDRTLPSAPQPASRKTQKTVSSRSAGQAKPAPRRKQAAKAKPRRSFFWRFTGKAVYWGLVLAIWGGIGIAGIVGYYGSKLPSSASWAIPERPPNAKIVSRDGELIANRGKTGGASMRLNEMSPYIPMAVIAIEDRRYRQHFGFDPIGFTRAMVTNVMAGRLVQGGSTLTQQLAKNMFLEPERTVERKVQELILALWLETQYSKDEILELYLNRVYFGSGFYGLGAASRFYFGKDPKDLTL